MSRSSNKEDEQVDLEGKGRVLEEDQSRTRKTLPAAGRERRSTAPLAQTREGSAERGVSVCVRGGGGGGGIVSQAAVL